MTTLDHLVRQHHPLTDCANCEWNRKGNYVHDSLYVDGNRASLLGSSDVDSIDLLVIGEAPGSQEIDKDMAFVGPSGQLLRTVLERTGNLTGTVRFTNAVACHPSFTPGKTPEAPSKATINACRPRINDLAQRASNVLVLGNTAKESYLQTTAKISEVRKGMPKPTSHYPKMAQVDGQKIVATFHPAAALRSADYYPSIVGDVRKLKRKYRFKEPAWRAFADYVDIPDCLFELESLIDYELPIAVDIETSSEKDSSFTHPKEWLSISITFRVPLSKDDLYSIVIGGDCLRSDHVLTLLRALLTRNYTIYHNAKFDVQVLMRLGVLSEPKFSFDTMLAHYVLDERPGYHGLKELSEEILGAPDYSDNIKPYVKKAKGDFAAIPRGLLYRYNAFDSYCTYLLWLEFEPKVGGSKQMARLLEQAQELIRIELNGTCVDMDYLDRLDQELTDELKAMETDLEQYYPAAFDKKSKPKAKNVNSVPQTKAALAALDIKVQDTSRPVLVRAVDRYQTGTMQHTFLVKLLAHRKVKKLHGTYVKGTRKRIIDGRVFPTFLQHGTVFGRLSSRNPNIQNIPRDKRIKLLYVAAPGNVLVQCDYSQVELRVIACESEDTYLQGVFKDPTRDIHGEVSDRLFGKGNWTKEDRVRAKVYVFGSIYGLSPFSIALSYGIPEAQAAKEQREFFSLIPDVMRWRDEITHRAIKDQRLMTHFGRIRRFPLITRSNKESVYKEALAFMPQSTANDICLESMVKLNRAFRNPEVKWHGDIPQIKFLVHDSITVECHEEDQVAVLMIMRSIMELTPKGVYSTFVPFAVSAEVGTSWGNLQEVG